MLKYNKKNKHDNDDYYNINNINNKDRQCLDMETTATNNNNNNNHHLDFTHLYTRPQRSSNFTSFTSSTSHCTLSDFSIITNNNNNNNKNIPMIIPMQTPHVIDDLEMKVHGFHTYEIYPEYQFTPSHRNTPMKSKKKKVSFQDIDNDHIGVRCEEAESIAL